MTSEAKGTGRPRNDESRQRFYDTQFHQFLVEKLPEGFVKKGRVDTLKLSEALDCTRFTIYRYLANECPSRKFAEKLISISKGTLTSEDLARFVIKA